MYITYNPAVHLLFLYSKNKLHLKVDWETLLLSQFQSSCLFCKGVPLTDFTAAQTKLSGHGWKLCKTVCSVTLSVYSQPDYKPGRCDILYLVNVSPTDTVSCKELWVDKCLNFTQYPIITIILRWTQSSSLMRLWIVSFSLILTCSIFE